jgi:transposase-like protein
MSSDRPKGGVDYPRTFQEFRDWFPTDDACVDYLEQLRWPDGFVCPECGGGDGWRISQRRMWMCSSCGRKTSVTAGTIFHRSHTPLSTWFAAAWFVTSTKNGTSALALQQQLGFGSYETAWAWLHKLRRAMVRPDRDLLTGFVELDETFVGGVSVGKDGAGTDKVPVQVAVERVSATRLGGCVSPSPAAPAAPNSSTSPAT